MSNITDLGDQWERELIDSIKLRRRNMLYELKNVKRGGEYQEQILRIVRLLDKAISAISPLPEE